MSKDPAFLFYPGDYLGGTMGFTLEQHGAYFLCLLLNFNSGRFTEEQARAVCGDTWLQVRHKFSVDSHGFFFNKRIEEEKKKRSSYCESRRKIGSHTRTHTQPRMEDEDEDGICIKKGGIKGGEKTPFTPPTVEEVRAYCLERKNGIDPESFVAFYESKGWKVGAQTMKKWQAAVITWEKRSRASPGGSAGEPLRYGYRLQNQAPPARPVPRPSEKLPEPDDPKEVAAAASKVQADIEKLTEKYKMPGGDK